MTPETIIGVFQASVSVMCAGSRVSGVVISRGAALCCARAFENAGSERSKKRRFFIFGNWELSPGAIITFGRSG